jgi:hypothetical protein
VGVRPSHGCIDIIHRLSLLILFALIAAAIDWGLSASGTK